MPLTPIFSSSRSHPCEQRALVLDAVGIESQIVPAEDRYVLLVAADRAADARAQLQRYEAENRVIELPPAPLFLHPHAWIGTVGYVVVLLLVGYLAGEDMFGIDWTRVGALTGTMTETHEWWRVVTSLTLHADLGHLFGNLLIGGVLGYFAGQLFGPGVAWLSILCAGALGGIVEGVLMPVSHATIGASGAVFATLGLVAAYTWRQRANPRMRWAQRTAPLLAAAAVLAMLGSGGDNTDVLAHLTGFASGLAVGLLYARMTTRRFARARIQLIGGAIALLVVGGAWTAALW
ncbi:MAG TPA: rhomboid family intramembrane serine protease [Steroidobacteraceae bacterium]|nr:rhomboid family intramembrane serine protease [Steroidobacteraceae bacterium]